MQRGKKERKQSKCFKTDDLFKRQIFLFKWKYYVDFQSNSPDAAVGYQVTTFLEIMEARVRSMCQKETLGWLGTLHRICILQ